VNSDSETTQYFKREDSSNPQRVEDRVAAIICTRGRPSLDDLMRSICECHAVPQIVIVVDASANQTPGDLSIEQFDNELLKIIRIGATPGLPHQRNIGIEFVLESLEYRHCDILAFLDDDVEVSPNYFENLISCFDSAKNVICLGSVDVQHKEQRQSPLALRLALVSSVVDGKLLMSGFATLPPSNTHLSETEWVPGFAVSFRRSILENNRFDSRIAFYGEDLEFQLRIGHLGKIAVSNRLRVTHRQSPLSRDSTRDHWGYSDGFRWSMAERFPKRVKKFAVIWSTLALMTFEMVRYIQSKGRRPPLELLGHCDFLLRLVSSAEVQKLRSQPRRDVR